MNLGDDDAFSKLEESGTKKVLYFTASWCPPCRRIGPIFEAMAKDYPSITFAKVDVDNLPEAAGDNQIRSVPTFIFKNGRKTIGQFAGADDAALKKDLDLLLAN